MHILFSVTCQATFILLFFVFDYISLTIRGQILHGLVLPATSLKTVFLYYLFRAWMRNEKWLFQKIFSNFSLKKPTDCVINYFSIALYWFNITINYLFRAMMLWMARCNTSMKKRAIETKWVCLFWIPFHKC